jgi:hypothetical protein
MPAGFKPEDSKGLGMKIVLSLVQQIGGTLRSAALALLRGRDSKCWGSAILFWSWAVLL